MLKNKEPLAISKQQITKGESFVVAIGMTYAEPITVNIDPPMYTYIEFLDDKDKKIGCCFFSDMFDADELDEKTMLCLENHEKFLTEPPIKKKTK